jgi:hypothetical protein
VLPDQTGDGLVTGSFAFDHLGLGVSEPFELSPTRPDILLLGDSIVLGASSLDQPERLGPVIERQTGWNVWPLSAGSWALWNELRVVERHPELLDVDLIVIVVNDGDFDRPSEWRSEMTHPRSRPLSYAVYAVQKFMAGPTPSGRAPFPVRRSDLRKDWAHFVSRTKARVLVVGYAAPKAPSAKCRWRPDWLVEKISFACYDVLENGGRATLVDGSHPNAEGNLRLARFIEAFVRRSLQNKQVELAPGADAATEKG